MAWIYLAGSEDSLLPWRLGSDQSPTVRMTGLLNPFSCQECAMGPCLSLQSGTMLQHCDLGISALLKQGSISFSVVFPARTSALREMGRAWAESEVAFSLKSQDWLANYDQLSFSWKTCQLSLLEDSPTFAWPSLRSGTIVGGRLYQPQKLEPSTFENDGSYLPTPTACDYGKNVGRKSDGITPSGRDRHSLTVLAKLGEIPNHPRGKLNPEWIEQAMGYPIAWTELTPWAMQWFRSKRGKRLKD